MQEVVRQVSDDPQQNVDFATDPNLSAVNPALPNGRRLLKNSRKMLGELSLSGDGVSAGNSEAGVQADAYGQGEDDNLQSTHIRVSQLLSVMSSSGHCACLVVIALLSKLCHHQHQFVCLHSFQHAICKPCYGGQTGILHVATRLRPH